MPQNNRDRIIDELGNIINELNILSVWTQWHVGCDFTIAANKRKRPINTADLAKLKVQAVEYINYAKSVNPKLFRLSLESDDKTCEVY